ncbi:hypothetical protein Tco_1391699 [Tanacetum coccineum]
MAWMGRNADIKDGILFSIHSDEWKSFQSQRQTALRGSNALSWKPCQGGSSKLSLPDHRRLLASFQDDAKYEHVGQDTRSQDGKDGQEIQGKDLKISEQKTKSKDNDKGSRSKITQHEGTSLQQDKDHDKDSRTQRYINLNSVQGSKIQDLSLENWNTTHWGRLLASKYICEHGSSESARNLASGEIVSLKILSRTMKLGY